MMPCQMSMEVMEYDPKNNFKPNVTEPVGVAKFLEEAAESRVTLSYKLINISGEKIMTTLDLKGLLCPMPIVKMAKVIKEVEVGQTFEAVATDPGVMADVPAWCRSTGNELVSLNKVEKEFHFVIRRLK